LAPLQHASTRVLRDFFVCVPKNHLSLGRSLMQVRPVTDAWAGLKPRHRIAGAHLPYLQFYCQTSREL